MITISLFAAAGFVVLSAGSLYLSSPHQRVDWLNSSPVALRLISLAGLIVALALLMQYFSAASAVFVLVTGFMLLCSILPIGIAYWRHNAGGE